ncbi:pyridoxamine 5'-phosphate oxidase family protein [Halorubellus sp. JP-L1]|uniref:pyridoxamine 5'-phosphate oxidase family protein n=1 Tax=Halorubellus sp. JP-L1 TaxID=2715753 RepID=UPI00140A6816|nr:pyridoxamine 5'-phosphate oxidase family protein [Halorubellus sp. JP-L1]NHN42363.1 pyridoxamine 5'-phosphate oxidase family protein [Halorubellus sp. JP-L1]
MADVRSVSLTATEIEGFLGDGGTGVLAVARDDEPYAFPVSYGFDADDGEFYLRLGYDDDSAKAAFVDEPCPAQLVVYEEATDGDGSLDIKSVVATGDLVRIPKDELTPEDVERLGKARTPEFEVWEQAKADIEFTVNKLVPESITGRRNVSERADSSV